MAHRWFGSVGRKEFATCPFTQNAVLRILRNPGYSNSFGTPAVISEMLSAFCALPGHAFLPDDISLLDCPEVAPSRLLHSGQVSDTYLLALAATHGASWPRSTPDLSRMRSRMGQPFLK
jgi:predicted nucleic acid-binding protein